MLQVPMQPHNNGIVYAVSARVVGWQVTPDVLYRGTVATFHVAKRELRLR